MRVLIVDDHQDSRESLAELVCVLAASWVSEVYTTCNTGAMDVKDDGWDLIICDPCPRGSLTPQTHVDARLNWLRKHRFVVVSTRPTNEPAALGFILKGECATSVLGPIFAQLCMKAA